jgi:hypothetical protein
MIFFYFSSQEHLISICGIFVMLNYLCMKKILLIGCLCLFGFLSHTQADTIYAVVNADTAIIRHDSYHTNCASLFVMEFNELDYHINVYEIDTGDIAYCLCYFNLATKIGPLSAGTYTVDVYGKWRDYPNELEWFGSTSFTIEGNAPGSPLLLGNFQSDCYQNVGIEDVALSKESNLMMEIYPNPVSGIATLSLTLAQSDKVEITAFSSMGQLACKVFDGSIEKGNQKIYWDVARLNQGIYFLNFRVGEDVFSRKVIIAY